MPNGTWGITRRLPEVETIQRWVKVTGRKQLCLFTGWVFCFVLFSVLFWEPRTQLVFDKVDWCSGTCLLILERHNWICSLGKQKTVKNWISTEDSFLYFQYILITFWILPRTLISIVLYWGFIDFKKNRNFHAFSKSYCLPPYIQISCWQTLNFNYEDFETEN